MSKYWQLFLDDERMPPSAGVWIVARNLEEAVEQIEHQKCFPTHISFDHDLGDNIPTGYDFAKWLVYADMYSMYTLPDDFSFYVHSQNPVGKKNIEHYLNNYIRFRSNGLRKEQ